MSDSAHPVRSYQRIFRPDRRVYAIDGRRIPVPGGVPLEWLCWAFCSLAGVLVLGERSIVLALVAAVVGGAVGAGSHAWAGLALGALAGFVVTLGAGVVLDWVDWPLRLLVVPGLVATLAGQAGPDGRAAHRYLRSWVALQLRAARRSLDGPLPREVGARDWAPRVWIAGDEHSPVLHHGRVRGPARLVFARPVVVTPGRGRMVVRRSEGHRVRTGQRLAEVIELGEGQVVEVRP
jgi:hypothetical protein